MKHLYRLGTRNSQLARVQSEWVKSQLLIGGVACELVPISSQGDENREPLYEIESANPGLFTKELESALLLGTIDLAVHSLKDLPTVQPVGLKIACIPPREDPSDVLILSPKYKSLDGLPKGACVGTSSLRREAQLLNLRPDLIVAPIRGNVPTRIEKVLKGEFQATILARAGLNRLNLKIETQLLSFVSAPGQGALCVEIREDCPAELLQSLKRLNDKLTTSAVLIERKILNLLEGGCTLPLGVHVDASKSIMKLRAFLGIEGEKTADGKRSWKRFETFDILGADEDTLVTRTVEHFRAFL